jgi:hypothetical protein
VRREKEKISTNNLFWRVNKFQVKIHFGLEIQKKKVLRNSNFVFHQNRQKTGKTCSRIFFVQQKVGTSDELNPKKTTRKNCSKSYQKKRTNSKRKHT